MAEPTDGRRRKGERRRRLLLDATLRVIERDGTAAVSQRAVAREAAVAPSAVLYYFPTVDDLLVATLTAVNDEYLRILTACAATADPVAALAVAITSSTRRPAVVAEYELFLLAARRPELRGEYVRWSRALDAFLAPFTPSARRRAGAAAAVDGLFLRCSCDPEALTPKAVHEVLDDLLAGPAGAAGARGGTITGHP